PYTTLFRSHDGAPACNAHVATGFDQDTFVDGDEHLGAGLVKVREEALPQQHDAVGVARQQGERATVGFARDLGGWDVKDYAGGDGQQQPHEATVSAGERARGLPGSVSEPIT